MQEASLLFSFPELVRCYHIYFLSHPVPTQLALPSLTTSVEHPQALRGDLALKDPLDCPSWPLRTFVVKESSSIKGRKNNYMGLTPLQAIDKSLAI